MQEYPHRTSRSIRQGGDTNLEKVDGRRLKSACRCVPMVPVERRDFLSIPAVNGDAPTVVGTLDSEIASMAGERVMKRRSLVGAHTL
jgi:hypothetical protein